MDRARRGVSGALSLAIRFSKAEFRSEGLATGVSTPREVLTVRSRATQARESGQVRKEAALSGNYGCRGSALPEPNSMDTPGDFVSKAERTVHFLPVRIKRLASFGIVSAIPIFRL